MKLKYNSVYTFSSADIFDNTDPPLLFEAHSRQSSGWARAMRDWIEDGADDVEQGLDIIGMSIIAVSQNGERYPLTGREGAESLMAAIEETNPGSGGRFICHLAIGHYNYHFNRLQEKLGNLEEPSYQSDDGNDLTQ